MEKSSYSLKKALRTCRFSIVLAFLFFLLCVIAARGGVQCRPTTTTTTDEAAVTTTTGTGQNEDDNNSTLVLTPQPEPQSIITGKEPNESEDGTTANAAKEEPGPLELSTPAPHASLASDKTTAKEDEEDSEGRRFRLMAIYSYFPDIQTPWEQNKTTTTKTMVDASTQTETVPDAEATSSPSTVSPPGETPSTETNGSPQSSSGNPEKVEEDGKRARFFHLLAHVAAGFKRCGGGETPGSADGTGPGEPEPLEPSQAVEVYAMNTLLRIAGGLVCPRAPTIVDPQETALRFFAARPMEILHNGTGDSTNGAKGENGGTPDENCFAPGQSLAPQLGVDRESWNALVELVREPVEHGMRAKPDEVPLRSAVVAVLDKNPALVRRMAEVMRAVDEEHCSASLEERAELEEKKAKEATTVEGKKQELSVAPENNQRFAKNE